MSDTTIPAGIFELVLTPSPAVFELDEVLLHDGIDELFRLELLLRSVEHEVDLAALVGATVDLSFPSPAGPLKLSGIVIRATQEQLEETGVSFYRLIAAPRVWLMTGRTTCRIYQHQSALELAEHIAGRKHVPVLPLKMPTPALGAERHEHITQYGESDWQLLQRLFAEDGIATAIAYDGHGTLHFSEDSTVPFARVSQPVPFVSLSQLNTPTFHVHDCTLELAVAGRAMRHRDFNFENPRSLLEGDARSPNALGIEERLGHYDFRLGAFRDTSAGDRLAARHLDGERGDRLLASFQANFTLAPGTAFTLEGHPRADVNIEWLVLRCETRARGPSSTHRLQCIPLATPRRPKRIRKPRVLGTQTAIVVGEGDIDVDRYGRVCLKFHWDPRPDTKETTRRVRVSQGWAGPGYGFVCLPRVGDEVIVEFLDGDPDQPIVIGRVHNAIAMTPQALPAQATRTTWQSRSSPGGEGFNEITFEDAAGAELVFMHAARDAAIEVLNDVNIRVDGHVNSNIKGNASGGVVGSGSFNITGITKLTVGAPLDVHATELTASADGTVALIAGGQRRDESCNHFVKTGGFYAEASSVAQFVTPNFHVFSGDIRLVAGGSKIEITGGGIAITSSGPVAITGSGPVTIASGGPVTINGSGPVTIASGGPVTINGSVVKLNC